MSNEDNEEHLGSSGLQGPVSYFAEYCEEEKQRRLDSDDDYDEEYFDQLVDLVMHRLKALEVDE